MALTTGTFARLAVGPVAFGSTGDAAGDASGERRHSRRVEIGQRARARDGNGPPWRTVLVRDLSVEGIGLQVDEPMPVGHLLVVRLDGADGTPIDLPCVVRWCEAGGFLHESYWVGAAFIEPPTPRGPGPDRPRWVDEFIVERQRRRLAGTLPP